MLDTTNAQNNISFQSVLLLAARFKMITKYENFKGKVYNKMINFNFKRKMTKLNNFQIKVKY